MTELGFQVIGDVVQPLFLVGDKRKKKLSEAFLSSGQLLGQLCILRKTTLARNSHRTKSVVALVP